MEKLPLSLAIITLNEEENISRCIQSVPFASEVIVVDSHSDDKTCEIARQLGAKVLTQSWLGFEKQKQWAVDQCQNQWVLSLDADEYLSEELQQEIHSLLKQGIQNKNLFEAYRIPRLSRHFGRWIRHGGWYPDFQTRLFNKEKARWAGGEIHESIQAESVGQLQHNILHHVFKDLSHQVITNDRYSTLGAKTLIERKVSFSLLKLIFRPLGKFIETYIIKRGFLDGIPGFIIAVGAAYSLFLRYAKVYENQKKWPKQH